MINSAKRYAIKKLGYQSLNMAMRETNLNTPGGGGAARGEDLRALVAGHGRCSGRRPRRLCLLGPRPPPLGALRPRLGDHAVVRRTMFGLRAWGEMGRHGGCRRRRNRDGHLVLLPYKILKRHDGRVSNEKRNSCCETFVQLRRR